MATGNVPRHIILTGPPGVGKTTLIHKACEAIQKVGIRVNGFYTEEIRVNGKRTGFDVVTLDGKRGQLARISGENPNAMRQYRVGQYTVQLQSFEQTALPTLQWQGAKGPVYVIDEVGKMELFSRSFIQAVRDLFAKPSSTVLTTLPIPKGRPIAFVEEIRSNKEAVVFQISRENRGHILDDILQAVVASYRRYS